MPKFFLWLFLVLVLDQQSDKSFYVVSQHVNESALGISTHSSYMHLTCSANSIEALTSSPVRLHFCYPFVVAMMNAVMCMCSIQQVS